jgi:transcriptional regulator GlxA family with amidase domain
VLLCQTCLIFGSLLNIDKMKKLAGKKVSILVLEDCTPMAPVAIMEIFNKAGLLHQHLTGGRQPFFETELVGMKTLKVKSSARFSLTCHTTIDRVLKTDILLIPAIEFDIENKLERNKALIPHLLRLHKKGTELGGMCTGAFVLAATGLLKNKSATTHWHASAAFRSMFPDVRLEDHKIIVDENGLYSSGGATSSLQLGLYLTEKYCGKETANQAARMLQMDNKFSTQGRFSIFMPQTQHSDEAIHKVQKAIEDEQEIKQSVESLAGIANMSRRSFIRRFKTATGNTPIEYLHRVNVEKAKRQLETGKDSVERIIYSLGYNDLNSFRKIFIRYTDLTPKEYRWKYSM